MRDQLAHQFYRSQGRRYPLEEYLSAGNLGLAEGLAAFDAGRAVPLPVHLRVRMVYRMRNVRLTEAGHGNMPERSAGPLLARYVTVAYNPACLARLHPPLAHTGYARRYLWEVWQYLTQAAGHLPDLGLLAGWLLGESPQKLAAQTGLSVPSVDKRLHRTRRLAQQYDATQYAP